MTNDKDRELIERMKDVLKTPNAKLTGDPQPYRGASSEQSERG